ncbi:UNVERIFIED_CONTAM: flagellar operon protein [Acetivibrio alkalicellulosi]
MIINNNFRSNIGRVSTEKTSPIQSKTNDKKQSSFEEVLKSKTGENLSVKFSKHAQLRLETRNISLSDQQKEKISQAVKKAEQKGVRDSLVLLDDMAFVVNVKNRTVVTAVSSGELKENVFTNIDGAVIT